MEIAWACLEDCIVINYTLRRVKISATLENFQLQDFAGGKVGKTE